MTFRSLLDRIQARHLPPILEEGSVAGVRCEDHFTFIVPPDGKNEFIEFWKGYAFSRSCRIESWDTSMFPATHYAITAGGEVSDCANMIGASVPQSPGSPIYKAFGLYGRIFTIDTEDRKGVVVPGLPQHIAYDVDANHDFKVARSDIVGLGYRFFTPELEYEGSNGAILRQSFFGCQVPYGPFGELIQRVPGPNGEPFLGFSPDQIDDLYRFYDRFSRRLLAQAAP